MEDPRTFRGMPAGGFGLPGTELRRELTELVLAGTKTATASLEVEWVLDGDPVPVPGYREAVVDVNGRIVAVIETTECRVLRMADVDDEFARDEGEDFADADAWRVAHERFWNGYINSLRERMGDPDWSLTDDTRIVCQRFRLVERFPEPSIPGLRSSLGACGPSRTRASHVAPREGRRARRRGSETGRAPAAGRSRR